jgi:hypothetical protein
MNIEELERLKARLRSLPELEPDEYIKHLLMTNVFTTITRHNGEHCGTVGCIAGEYLLMNELAGRSLRQVAMLLQLPNEWLFFIVYWPGDLQRAYLRARTLTQQREIMCQAIDRYIQTEGFCK